ncbi:MAG: tetratricopeptide repeat protein [Bacteroidales bacterium]|nr:tetratricopeptide repeat protein [Bacteroidales bacterium]
MQFRLLSLLIVCLLCYNTYANTNDSIYSSKLFNQFKDCSPDSIERLIKLAEKIETQIHTFNSGNDIAKYYREIGMIFYQKSLFTYAESYFQKSYIEYLKLHNNKEIARSLSNIAVMRELSGDYKGAISKYFEVLDMMKNLKDNEGIGKVLNNIGLTYEEMGQRGKALEYLKQAALYKTASNDKIGLASTYNNIGVIYEELLPDGDSALNYYNKAFSLYSNINMSMEYAQVQNNIALVYLKQKDYNKANKLSIAALHIFDSIQSKRGIALTSRNLASINIEIGNIHKAFEYLNNSMTLCNQINDVDIRIDLYHLYQKLYVIQGDSENALLYFSKFNNLKDSLLNNKVQQSVAESEAKYKLKEHQFEIEQLNLQNLLYKRKIKTRQIFLSLLIIVLLSVAIILYMAIINFRMREKQMRLEIQNYIETIRKIQQEKKLHKHTYPNLEEFNLTEQEEKVLIQIAQGKTNLQIANELYISVNTVKFHVKNIYIKLDVKNRVQAINLIDSAHQA